MEKLDAATLKILLPDLIEKAKSEGFGGEKKKKDAGKETKKKGKAQEEEENVVDDKQIYRELEFDRCLDCFDELDGPNRIEETMLILLDDVLGLSKLPEKQLQEASSGNHKLFAHGCFEFLANVDFFVTLDFRFFVLKNSQNPLNVLESKTNEVNTSKYSEYIQEVGELEDRSNQGADTQETKIEVKEHAATLKSKKKRCKLVRKFLELYFEFEDKLASSRKAGLFDFRVLFKVLGSKSVALTSRFSDSRRSGCLNSPIFLQAALKVQKGGVHSNQI